MKRCTDSRKSDENKKLEELITNLIDEYDKTNSKTDLENSISEITNFRKSCFFKLFILNLVLKDTEEITFLKLLKFIYTRKYKPNNYKSILGQIEKVVKKKNVEKYNEKLDIIFNKRF